MKDEQFAIIVIIGLAIVFLQFFIILRKKSQSEEPVVEVKTVEQPTVDALPPEPPAPAADSVCDDKISITDEFREVAELLDKGVKGIFIHGGAGTGKSTLIDWLSKKRKIHVRLAPTGVAAVNISGLTIHKFFSLKPVEVFTKNERLSPPGKYAQAMLNVDNPVIVIDEISMVRPDLIDIIDRHLAFWYGNDLPFGGVTMIFVGDLFQLPPVVNAACAHFFDPGNPNFPPDEGWESYWFFDAKVFHRTDFKGIYSTVNLTKTFRQKDAEFITALNELRKYRNIAQNVDYFNKHIVLSNNPPNRAVMIVGTKAQANSYNWRRINELNGPFYDFKASKTGIFEDYQAKDYPAEELLQLKVGAFVMILYNDSVGRFVNGTTGIILAIDPIEKKIKLRLKNSQVVIIEEYCWESYAPYWDKQEKCFLNKLNGTYTQIPLALAYSITVHKSQGKTLDKVYLDVSPFASGQMYVALSRVRSISDITSRNQLLCTDFRTNNRLITVVG